MHAESNIPARRWILYAFFSNYYGRRFDVGEKFGFIETTIEFALKRPELKEQLLQLFKEKLDEAAVSDQ